MFKSSNKESTSSSIYSEDKTIITSFNEKIITKSKGGTKVIKKLYIQNDLYAIVNQGLINRALNVRLACVSGLDRHHLTNTNITTDIPEHVFNFWYKNYNFKEPEWLLKLIYGSTNGNKMLSNFFTYHPEANIDPICAHLFEENLESKYGVFHITIQLCIFERFANFAILNKDKFTLLKYGCVCNCFGVLHMHVLAVSMMDIYLISTLINRETCAVNEELQLFRKKITEANITPSLWPIHLHFKVIQIKTGWDLFCTIESLCKRNLSSLYEESNIMPVMLKDVFFHNTNANHNTRMLEKLFLGFVRDNFPHLTTAELERNGKNCHIFIFRSIAEYAPLWFSALTSKGAEDCLRRYLQNTSIITKCHLVFDHDRPKLLYKDLLEFLPFAAIPLHNNQFIYHDVLCSRHEKKPEESYFLHLGNNDYINVATDTTVNGRCCNSFIPDLLTLACGNFIYELNDAQKREYHSFCFWTTINKLNFIKTIENWKLIPKSEL